MEPLASLHLQLQLEGKEVLRETLLRQVEVVPGEAMPLALIARLATGRLVVYYDEAVDAGLHKELMAVLPELKFPDVELLLTILRSHGISFEVGHYKTYVFPSMPARDNSVKPLSGADSRVKAFGFDGFVGQVYVIERGGRIASACVSAREDNRCGEAWVYTDPEYRRQGFAQQVVHTWAGHLIEAGKIPFYSHKIENTASANLAAKLGLQPAFEELAINQVSGQ